MGDIWRAGLPAPRRNKTAWLPALWWTAWLLSGIFISSGSSQSGGSSGSSLSLDLPGASSFSLCALAISGTLVIPVILTVSAGPVAGAPAASHGGPAQSCTQRKTPPSVVAALLAVVLGLAGSGAAAVGVIGVSTYHADTVHLRTGHPVLALLSPGRYDVFADCGNDISCWQLRAGELSVHGALSTPVGVTSDSASEWRTEAGQPFVSELSFSIPAREPVRFTLHTGFSDPVFIAPSEDELPALYNWIAVAAISGAVLFGLPAAFAWLLTRRDRFASLHAIAGQAQGRPRKAPPYTFPGDLVRERAAGESGTGMERLAAHGRWGS